MKKFLVRTAVAAGAGAMMMLGTAGAASAVSPDIDPESGYYGLDFNPAETKLIANSGVGGILGFVPEDNVFVYAYNDVLDNIYPWSPASAQRIFNDSAAKNEAVGIGILDPRAWDRLGVAIIQLD